MHNNNKIYKTFHALSTHLKSTKLSSYKTCFDLSVLISRCHIVMHNNMASTDEDRKVETCFITV